MKKGFSLIELLVVVLIIGILAAIALPQYQVAVFRTRFNALRFTSVQITQALERYYLVAGKYTSDWSQLDIEVPKNITCYQAEIPHCYFDFYGFKVIYIQHGGRHAGSSYWKQCRFYGPQDKSYEIALKYCSKVGFPRCTVTAGYTYCLE